MTVVFLVGQAISPPNRIHSLISFQLGSGVIEAIISLSHSPVGGARLSAFTYVAARSSLVLCAWLQEPKLIIFRGSLMQLLFQSEVN